MEFHAPAIKVSMFAPFCIFFSNHNSLIFVLYFASDLCFIEYFSNNYCSTGRIASSIPGFILEINEDVYFKKK